MIENFGEQFADADPEYAADAAADVDPEAPEFEAADPETVPPDEGDAGHAEPPGDDH
jgi:hypothetical protein